MICAACLLVAALWSIMPLHAQGPNVIFNHNKLEQGLNYDQIEDLMIDRDGFIWIATSTGLHVFNGYDYTTYHHNSIGNPSISENFITSLFEDSSGKVWIGTFNNGLNLFDKVYDTFYNFRHNPADSSSLSSNKILRMGQVLAEDQNGMIWVSTDQGLNRIDPSSKLVECVHEDLYGQIIFDPEENVLWIADTQLMKFDTNQKGLLTVHPFDDSGMENEAIHSLILDEDGMIWMGTDAGLRIYDKRNHLYRSLEHFVDLGGSQSIQEKITDQPITALYEDFNGNIWIGSGKDIFVLGKRDRRIFVISHEPGNINSLLDDHIRGIYGARTGMVLITYASRGITMVDIRVQNFTHLKKNRNTANSLSSNTIRSIFEDRNKDLWLGTYNHGLNRLLAGDPNRVVAYQHDPDNPTSLSSNYITAIYIDSRDRLWVGTFEDGFCFVDRVHDSKDLFFERSRLPIRVEVHEFTEDQQGKVWISTNFGYYIYDPEPDSLFYYGDRPGEVAELQQLNVQSSVFQSSNVLWFATWNRGIGRLILGEQDSLLLFDRMMDEEGKPIDNGLITIIQDREKHLWMGSGVDGLIRLTEIDGEFRFSRFDKARGAPDNTVYGVLEDRKGHIWISTKNGLGSFNPETELFQNYYESDGLQSNSFIWDSQFRNREDRIFFGGINGLTVFYPDSIYGTESESEAYISNLIINHEPVDIHTQINGRYPLERNIRYTETLTLSHNEPIFSLEFAALNVNNPGEVQFAHMLEGFDEDWIYSGSENRMASYTNLNPGTYRFLVKASRNFGNWGETSADLEIKVLPPWWRTIFAYFGYAILILALLYLFQNEVVKRTALKHSLEMEQFKREKDNEMNQEKFRFFTNLSHEYRTPLTLIIGPLDRMIRKNDTSGRVHQNLLLIRKQAHKLQKLTTQLINFRKYEIDNLQLKAAEGNIVGFLEEITVAFRQHARSRNIDFGFKHKDRQIQLYYDRDKLEIIVVNLLSNAFKFTPPGGSVTLRIKLVNYEERQHFLETADKQKSARYGELDYRARKFIQIEVSDTGCGIDPDQLCHIFKRYYQASNIQNISVEGSGIGMEMAKSYIELHKGSIMVTSELDSGTTFFFWLPMGRNHLTEEEIIKEFKSSEHKDHYRVLDPSVQEQYAELLTPEKPEKKEDQLPVILAVDDNLDILLFLEDYLKDYYQVHTALNGKEGLEKAFELVPDLVISDIMMPEVDGLELCKKIKVDQRTSHIPVILLTARTSTVFQAEGYETGADDYISKPFDVHILNLRVNNLIESRKALRQRYSREVTLKPRDISITRCDEKFLDAIIGIIEKHISDSGLKVEQIAKDMGMSHSVLYRKVLALTDLTLVEFIRTIRLKRAAAILQQSDEQVNEISYAVGFTDPKYFSKCFQAFYGLTPTAYRDT